MGRAHPPGLQRGRRLRAVGDADRVPGRPRRRAPAVSVRVRCLQVAAPAVEKPARQGGFEPVDHLEVDGKRHVDWDEAVERVVDLSPLPLLPGGPFGWRQDVLLRRRPRVRGAAAAPTARSSVASCGSREAVAGLVRIATQSARARILVVKVAVTVENTTAWSRPRRAPGRGHGRSAWSPSTPCWPSTTGASSPCSIRPTMPPGVAHACRSDGAFPVLIGDDDRGARRRRSSSTTTPRWPPRARATSTTPSRSTRSSPCGS